MNGHRSAALALVAGVAAFAAAACSAGVTSAGPGAAGRPAASSPASGGGTTIRVGGTIGRFPIPPGATVVENGVDIKKIVITLGSVTPAEVSRFYASALPRYGYRITTNKMASLGSKTGAEIDFTGHGYKGGIVAVSDLTSPGADSGLLGKEFVGIELDPA
jgi:hypothetical protein